MADDDKTITIDMSSGTPHVQLDTIRRVDLINLVGIEAYRIMRTDDGTVHEITFLSGGGATFSYTNEGKIRSFNVTNGTTQITEGGAVVAIGPQRSDG